MTDETKIEQSPLDGGKSSRRTLLKLGALAAPAVVTLKPALATQQTSLALCRIPIEKICIDDKDKKAGDFVTADFADDGGFGGEMDTFTGGGGKKCYDPPSKGYYYGQELIDYRLHGTLPDGVSEKQFEEHLKYIKKLRPGDDGFTCLTSLVHKL